MIRVGFVGWRGMVGSVLMQRMLEEDNFKGFQAVFFSTSQASQVFLLAEPIKKIAASDILQDAYDFDVLKSVDVIVTCQGSSYTQQVFPELRKEGWKGFWIDAASHLRLDEESIIAFPPINQKLIEEGIARGVKNFIGANCTVSIMLMAIGKLFKENLIDWVNVVTYQAYSGAGAKMIQKFIEEIVQSGTYMKEFLKSPNPAVLELEKILTRFIAQLPIGECGYPLLANLCPLIGDMRLEAQTEEEYKLFTETQKILNLKEAIPIESLCTRVGTLRSHSLALTLKLKKDLELSVVEELIASNTPWTKVIKNEETSIAKELTPLTVSRKLEIHAGRIRKLKIRQPHDFSFCRRGSIALGSNRTHSINFIDDIEANFFSKGNLQMKNRLEQFSNLPNEDHFKLEFALQFLEIKEAVKKGNILLDQITSKTRKQLGKLTYHGIRWTIAKEYLNLDEALDLSRTEARWSNLEFFSVRLAVDQGHITLGKALKLTQNQCDNLESFFVQQAIEQGYLTLD